MVREIARENVKTKLKTQGNKIMSCIFIKKDQTERKMTFRFGVKKYLKGGSNKVEAEDRSYITVYDMKAQGYRTLNLRTLKQVKIAGLQYKVV
jgi:hypothetical protein